MMPLISSSSNKVYKKLLSLTNGKGIKEHDLCIISGENLCREYLSHHSDHTNCFWLTMDPGHSLCEQWPLPHSLEFSRALFDSIDICGTGSPLLIAPTAKPTAYQQSISPTGHEIFCALGDPNNLGALIRSAVAFNIEKIILLQEACHPFHPKAIKSSAGTVFSANIEKGPSIHDLKIKNLYALDANGTPLHDLDNSPKCFLLGEEGAGLPAQLEAHKISIPINSKVESLNATVAASVLFYELNKK